MNNGHNILHPFLSPSQKIQKYLLNFLANEKKISLDLSTSNCSNEKNVTNWKITCNTHQKHKFLCGEKVYL